MDAVSLFGSAAGLGWLAGIRLYFTVFALGLAVRLGWFQPSDEAQYLHLLASTPVLVISGIMLVCEFAADKIPWFDSIWDSVHTLIRPAGAAALGVAALGSWDEQTTLLAGLISGGAALTGHTSKAAARAAINHSPEPFSNWLMSSIEDLFVPFGLWVVLAHPLVAAIAFLIFLVIFILLARTVWRLFMGVLRHVRSKPA